MEQKSQNGERLEGWVALLCLLSFWSQALYGALRFHDSVAPDEHHHLQLSRFFSVPGVWRIVDGPETWTYGPISRFPYFYHLLMGKLLQLNFTGLSDLLFLRLVNIGLATLFMVGGFWLIRDSLRDRSERILAYVILTHLPMLALITGAVSYDNFINGVGVWSVLFFCRWVRTASRTAFLGTLLLLLVGCLAKLTVLPLVLILGGLFFYFLLTDRALVTSLWRAPWTRGQMVLLVSSLAFLGLNVELYGINLVRYHAVQPSADKVLGYDIALEHYAQFRRDIEFDQTVASRSMMSFRHFFTSYFTHASEGIFGIKSHQSLLRSTRVNLLYRLGLFPLVWGLVMLIRSRKRMARHLGILLTVAVGYWAVVFAENYSVYRATRVFGAGLQGRYLFPALVPGLVFFVWLGLDFLPPRWRGCVATGMALIFVGCSFPFLIRYFGPEWY